MFDEDVKNEEMKNEEQKAEVTSERKENESEGRNKITPPLSAKDAPCIGDFANSNKPSDYPRNTPAKNNSWIPVFIIWITGLCLILALAVWMVSSVKTLIKDMWENVQNTTTITEPYVNADPNKEIVLTPSNNDTAAYVYSVENIVEANMPAMVSVSTTFTYVENYWFFGPQAYQGSGAGSGFVIKNENDEISILTNAHVVEDSDTIAVTFIDSETYPAVLKSIDSKADLALLSVNAKEVKIDTMNKIKCVKLGDSDNLKLGQAVIAIGNSLGYGQTVTTGVVSAINREITDESGNTHILIQTDAAINAGNSGGVLLDMNGCVIGINEAKIADASVEGVGFAIPITDALETINLLSTVEVNFPVESAKRGKLGITCVAVDKASAEMFGMPQGIMIREVATGEASDKAGLKENDVIIKIDDKKVSTMNELSKILDYHAIGDDIKVTYMRATDGKWEESTVTVNLTAWTDMPQE